MGTTIPHIFGENSTTVCSGTIDGENISWQSDGHGDKAFKVHDAAYGGASKLAVIQELSRYCGRISPSGRDMESWPPSVVIRWKALNGLKLSFELGILSWNTNGRLDLRGCRESLLKRWFCRYWSNSGAFQKGWNTII